MRGSLKASPRKPEREPARTRKPAEAGSAAGVTLPLWYWAPFDHFSHGLTAHGVQLGYFPNGPSGPGAAGVYVDTLRRHCSPRWSACSCWSRSATSWC
ncbi:MAG TPA: hypothetical protein VGS06_17555 [Streptosporangiaceae bacterium]|nr:hypothetical protein [Streptosporangiaceae bacterium]